MPQPTGFAFISWSTQLHGLYCECMRIRSFSLPLSWFAGCSLLFAAAALAQTAPAAPPSPTAPVAVPAAPSIAPKPPMDWADLARYQEADVNTAPPAVDEKRVVFMGDSITDAWPLAQSFPGKPYVNRGISGQTTPQMLVRFRPDVIALKPSVVVILAGINDIAENTGPISIETIEGNFASMVDLAQANGIRVVLSSVLPAAEFPWRPTINPVEKVAALNAWLKDYAARRGVVYLDYFPALQDQRRGLRAEYGKDAVHPNDAGYALMAPLAEKAIQQALQGPAPK
jgi:lysophospholipase L1-like esterase